MFHRFLALAVLSLSTVEVRADIAYPCPLCSTAQMANVSLTRAPNAPGVFSNYVYNVPGKILKHYSIECLGQNRGVKVPADAVAFDDKGTVPGLNVSPCNGTRYATEVSVEPGMAETFNTLTSFYDETNGTMRKDMVIAYNELPSTGLDHHNNIYELARNLNAQGAYGLHFYRNVLSRAGNWAALTTSYAESYFGIRDGATITITLVTTDGGKATYELKPGDTEAKYVPGSARTYGDQAVPDNFTLSTNPGVYAGAEWNEIGRNGIHDNLRDFAEHLRERGIPIYDGNRPIPTGTVIPGPVRKITCRMEGGQLKCQLIP